MLLKVACAGVFLFSQTMHGMMQQPCIASQRVGNNVQFKCRDAGMPMVNMIKDPKAQLTRAKDPRQHPRKCTVNLSQRLATAIAQDDAQAVKAHFDSWLNWVSSWGNYHDEIAEGLKLAVSQSPDKTGKVVAYLVEEASPTKIEQADCLLSAAANNGHIQVIKLINKLYPQLGPWALYDAINGNKATVVANLLIGGIDPNKGLGDQDTDFLLLIEQDSQVTIAPGAHHPVHLAAYTGKSAVLGTLLAGGGCADCKTASGLTPLDVAIKAFKEDDDQATIGHRLYIVRKILKYLTPEYTPHVDTLKLADVPQESRDKIIALLKRASTPTMLYEPAPSTEKAKDDATFAAVFACGVACCPVATLVCLDYCCKKQRS